MERRFFPPDRNLGVYFEWYDSLTGVPSCQRTIAFEKACTLFNLGAIYTQIGARHDRRTERGLDAAVDSFLRAAGIFRHIYDTFTNAPSMDLKPQVLDVLVSLMLSQARECLFEKLQLQIEALGLTESSHVSNQGLYSIHGVFRVIVSHFYYLITQLPNVNSPLSTWRLIYYKRNDKCCMCAMAIRLTDP